MAKAHIHALSSAKRWGGEPEEYMQYHLLLDSSKKVFGDGRHRALTHNTWFIAEIMPRIFGHTFVNSVGATVSVVDVCEQHVLEDYGGTFIPSPQDWLAELEWKDWMNNGRGVPPSFAKIAEQKLGKRAKYVVVDDHDVDSPAVDGGAIRHLVSYASPPHSD